ncbi:hypothetical protein CPB85DRAFT_1427157 [Mucidula mucida]|nr:hypothetical protein CPB85DRAFT_1427157 [Mucidula mucida]
MASSSVITSRSTLMHAALAYLSDEIRTVDQAIVARSTLPTIVISRSQFLSLPPELLAIIRSHLLLAITAQLMDRSVSALKRYELTLRVLLCPECIAYNQDVYGKDVWSWEQFSGACGCLQRGWRVKNVSVTQPISSTINPKQFIDRFHWLEYYLSRKSLRFLGGRASSPKRSPEIIWDAVSVVLEDFNCKLVLAKERRRRLLCRDVVVVPRDAGSVSAEEDADEWLNGLTLDRVDRDLGLSVHHANSIEEPLYPLSPSPSRPYYPSDFEKLDAGSYELSFVQPTLDSIVSLIATLFAIPIACTTLFLTIVCLYSRPGAFRVM